MDRFILITKPEQSGKTFIMINEINRFQSHVYSCERDVVNFILCDNSLLLTTQTKTRIKMDVSTLPGSDVPYVELSSRIQDNIHDNIKNNADQVALSILGKDMIRHVVCCSNHIRINDINKIIKHVNDITDNMGINRYVFKIWLDEADKFCNYITKSFIPLTKKTDNVDVYLITATSHRLFSKYGDLRVFPIENTTLPEYHGWKDNEIVICDDESSTIIGFARQIADEMIHRGEIKPGTKGFVPGPTDKKSHYAIRDMFLMKGFAVIVVNGDGIELSIPIPNSESVVIGKTEELHIHIRELYDCHKLSNYPFVLTGNICIGRGISILQPDFMIDFAIISNINNKSEASQIAGRMKGNIKNWPTYKPPKVYTTEKFNKVASDFEDQSRAIGRIAFEKAACMVEEDVVPVLTKNEAMHAGRDTNWELFQEEFLTLDDANRFLREHQCRQNKKASCKDTDENGFICSSTTKKKTVLLYNDVITEIRSWGKTTAFDLKGGNTKHSRMIICYKDLNDPESIVYIVRVIKKLK